MYQQLHLSDHTLIGAPGPLPYVIANWPDALVADCDAARLDPQLGFAGMGFWPVTIVTPAFDAATQIPDGTYTCVPDAPNKRATATANVRALTSDELAANLAAAQTGKIAELTAACAAQIVGGFASSALGAPHTYPSKIPVDQINLMGSVTDSLLPGLPTDWTTPFWCQDMSQVTAENPDEGWLLRAHTAVQIQQAGSDGKASVALCQTKLATLSAQVMTATTIAAVNAIAW